MDVILQSLSNPAEMSRLQWLLVAILAFIVIGSAFFVWKLYAIVMSSRKNPYVPNIGRKRLQKEADEARERGRKRGGGTD